MAHPLGLITVVSAVLSANLILVSVAAGRRGRWIGSSAALVFGLLFLTVAALAATLSVATQGYRALTREEVAAVVVTPPTGPERFMATFTFPDGRREDYELTGDAL